MNKIDLSIKMFDFNDINLESGLIHVVEVKPKPKKTRVKKTQKIVLPDDVFETEEPKDKI